ncbi:MAG: FixH family protein [Ignavibacteriaceae bacterium]
MKKQISWGTGVATAIGLFLIAVAALIIFSYSQSVDLVHDNYYERELSYQDEINSETNSMAIDKETTVRFESPDVVIRFPEAFDFKGAKGAIGFYKPNDATRDFTVPLEIGEGNIQKIPSARLSSGRWKIFITFSKDNLNYKINKEITL